MELILFVNKKKIQNNFLILIFFSNMSVANLKYLSSEQALADLAYFIVGMNKKYNLPKGTKWIAFGGSYPGNLAAWVRAKYPHLVHGAMSASGPLLAKIDFKGIEFNFELFSINRGQYVFLFVVCLLYWV